MDIAFYVAFFVVLLVLLSVAGPVARWIRLPVPVVQIVLGAGCAYGATLGLGIDTGLRARSFHDLVFYVFLPLIIFEAAARLSLRTLVRDIAPILFLALIGLAATVLICAYLVYHGIGHPTGFPWAAALLTGALLAATDPTAVSAELRRLGAPDRLIHLLEGEALFNDALAIVLFTVCLNMALAGTVSQEAGAAIWAFLEGFTLGLAVGLIGGGIAWFLWRWNRAPAADTVISLAAAYGVYLIAELAFNASGAMAALGAGLVVSRIRSDQPDAQDDRFWEVVAFLTSGCLFLLMGATITITMFLERWLAMLIAIAAATIARVVVVGGVFGVMRPLTSRPLSMRDQGIVIWGGARGGVTLALALSLPTELDYWWTIQSMAFGVVLFTLLIQVPTTPILLRWTPVSDRTDPGP